MQEARQGFVAIVEESLSYHTPDPSTFVCVYRLGYLHHRSETTDIDRHSPARPIGSLLEQPAVE